MKPRLVAIGGPLNGSVFALERDSLAMGREPSNQICLDDSSASLTHCRIAVDGERCSIHDLDSHTGTFVNSVPVKDRLLAHGDRIAVGSSVFLFLVETGEDTKSSPVEVDEDAGLSASGTQLRGEDVLYLHPEVLAALPPTERLARDLATLLKISVAIGSIRSVESLQWQLLGMLFDVVPAERGAILLVGGDLEEFTSAASWDRALGPQHPVHVSRQLARRVLREGVAVLTNDGLKSEKLEGTSTADTSAHSLVCVPLVALEKVLGLIYLDTRNPATLFTRNHLHLVAAIAGIAAMAVENARQVERLGTENRRLRADVSLQHDMVGESPRMGDVYQLIARVAPSQSTILIRGESGTGKELVARAIHQNSPRTDQPFVAINCAAITETLLESELFGHERGAFTGAVTQKKGQLEVADGGTVFLDEIAELSPALQAKLLRVLQERECLRVGGTRPVRLDIRVIAATNQDLPVAVREGRFRQDLYYRLNVVCLTVPPLREHREDIPLLARYFAAKYGDRCKRHVQGVSPEAIASLMRYDWPGNVRELENAIERAVVVGSSEFILPEDLPEIFFETDGAAGDSATGYHEAVRKLKKQLILNAVEQARGNFTEAAKLLGVHPNYLHRLVRNLDLRAALKKAGKE
jgi:transcriptional regulator with GAF, ATPase, and Fis domain